MRKITLKPMTYKIDEHCKKVNDFLNNPKTPGSSQGGHTLPFDLALTSFNVALQLGQLGPLMTQFGLGEDVTNAAAQGDLDAFVKAMQAARKRKMRKKLQIKNVKETKPSKPDEKDDSYEEEEMEH